MKPLNFTCSYCRNNRKKSNYCSSLSAKTSPKSTRRIRSCGNIKEGTNLHRFIEQSRTIHRISVERKLIKRASLFAIATSKDNGNNFLISVGRTLSYLSLLNGFKDGNASVSSGEKGGHASCRESIQQRNQQYLS